MLNPFNVFSVSEIGAAINEIPNRYGRINEMGLMPVKGVSTSVVSVESRAGQLVVIPASLPGGPATQEANNVARTVRTFSIPKFAVEEYVTPAEVQNVRAFGGSEGANMAALLAEKLVAARARHDITLEWHRVGALKGLLLDSTGAIIYDLYSEFGVSRQLQDDFLFYDDDADIRGACLDVVRHIEDNLGGEVSSGITALVRGPPGAARPHQLGTAARASLRHRHAALPELRRRRAQDHRGHPRAACHREDPRSPGARSAAPSPGAGA